MDASKDAEFRETAQQGGKLDEMAADSRPMAAN
jgi:hypothetical protein